jgi:hypothetical protein
MALLAIAGGAKIIDPAPTSGALRAAQLPDSHLSVRLLGVAELALAIGGIVLGGPASAMGAALLYMAFALFVSHALRNRLPISSCGCLGSAKAPPTRFHIVINLLAVVVMVWSALLPLDPVTALSRAPLSEAILILVFSGLTTYLLYALITVLPLRKASQHLAPVVTKASAHVGIDE